MTTRIALYIDTDTNGDDIKDAVGNNITAGWYVFDWPLNNPDPIHGPYDTQRQATEAEHSDHD